MLGLVLNFWGEPSYRTWLASRLEGPGLAPQECLPLPTATKCMASSCLQQGGMKESFWKVNTKNPVTKRAARGVNEEKAATLPLPWHTSAPPGRWAGSKVSPSPHPQAGLGPSQHASLVDGRSHPSSRAGSRDRVVPPVPSDQRLILQATGTWGYGLSDSTGCWITPQNHFLLPWAL